MNIIEFVSKFAEQFEETDVNTFSPESEYKNIAEWSSLSALSIISMVREDYNIKITGEDIRNSETIKDLFEIIKTKSQSA